MGSNQGSWFAIGDENRRFVYIITVVAALNGLLFGYDLGVISGALLYIEQTFSLSTVGQQLVVSGMLVGAMVGALVAGNVADRYGRRRTALAGAFLFFISSLGMALSPSVWWLIGWRFLVGVAVGEASIVGPAVIAEVAPPKIRGSLGTLQQFAITLGILLGYIFNYVFAGLIAGPVAWRWMLGFGMVPAAILGIGMYYLPDTPRWLLNEGREDEARETLKRIRSDSDIEQELQDIKEVVRTETYEWRAVFQPEVRPVLIVGVGLAVFQQISGINAVLYYAPTIFNAIGLGQLTSILSTIGIGTMMVVMTLVAVRYADSVGRRPLLLIGVSGMTIMLAALGLAFNLSNLSGSIGLIAVVLMILYVAFYAFSLGPMFWLMISEIYPLEVRGAGEGVASFANWGANLLVGLTFLSLVNLLGRGNTFWMYGVLCIAALTFIYFWVPETSGRSLEEIESDLRETGLTGANTDITEHQASEERTD
jgi:sugar porter (SP) family MFS transporter